MSRAINDIRTKQKVDNNIAGGIFLHWVTNENDLFTDIASPT